MTLLTLCWEFFKTGLFAIGGGLATLPFLMRMQARYQWFSEEMLANMIAISESTPGPIGVNMATYVGYTTYGIVGAVLSTFFLVLPSLIVIMLISRFLQSYQENRIVQNAFSCLRPVVTGLIAAAGFSVLKISLLTGVASEESFLARLNWPALSVFIVMLVAMFLPRLKKLHPIVFISIGAVLGVVLSL